MRAFRKDFIREITKNKGRFLSVFFIVLLGAAFFSGIRSAEGDMKVSADRYYDEVNYMDLKVLGTEAGMPIARTARTSAPVTAYDVFRTGTGQPYGRTAAIIPGG